jgi:competence protein ComEC
MGRWAAWAFVVGSALVHGLPALPHVLLGGLGVLGVMLAGAGVWQAADLRARKPWIGWIAWPALALCLGSATTMVRADFRMRDALDTSVENQAMTLTWRVAGLATRTEHGQRYEADLVDPPSGVPTRAMVFQPAAGTFAGPRQPGQAVVPGEIWTGRLALKRPHGLMNPHGFDYEAHLFQQGIRATGTVRGVASRVGDAPWATFDTVIQRVRHRLREAMAPGLEGARYGAVILALAMGDQAAIRKEDWRTFNLTGITHLVSISGLHVTMMAALGGAIAMLGWSRLSWRGVMLAERAPAQVMGACAALLVALAYCLVAGWGIPAQRTFFMLAVVAIAAIARLRLGGPRVLALAAATVTALDPWAPVSAGFWLSFGAVAVLMLAGSGRWRRRPVPAVAGRLAQWRHALGQQLRDAGRLQAALTLGLLPLLALMFQQVSLVSPFANAIAIPVVSLLVTPLALAAMFLSVLPGPEGLAHLMSAAAHAVFAAVMWPVQALADLPYASASTAAAPWPWVAVGLVGVAWTLQPAGLPRRWLGMALVLPVLCYRPERPDPGDWRLTALDVGQGGAAVLETATQTLVFDTGPPFGDTADAGERVVWPYLRSRGIRRIDHLLVSHGDADHAGGLASLLAAVPITAITASYDLAVETSWPPAFPGLPATTRTGPCEAGQAWAVDGVVFHMLYPDAAPPGSRGYPGDPAGARRASADRNANSCVLHVQGRHHSALLPGDIGAEQEAAILRSARRPGEVLPPGVGFRTGQGAGRRTGQSTGKGTGQNTGQMAAQNTGQMAGQVLAASNTPGADVDPGDPATALQADVALMAHHGSRHSSSVPWTLAVSARHAVAQAGYLNSYRHPHPAALARWQAAGAAVHRTDKHGAVVFTSQGGRLSVSRERERRQRYWHAD